ncbi:hypothetical protein [Pseudomonas sp. QTF5]|uniref:hypothetical protein n=1 Tax=Pseudomonas sp. QTF5 TaxID=1435425 RepID=UPI0021146731|nr:hypothetical protein [Pseudomonas sp. QTF5]
MDYSLALKVIDQERTESLRQRMDDVGCVFEFVVVAPEEDSLIDEAMHRLALNALYEQIMASQLDWHRKLILKLPSANYPEPSMTWALDRAIATPLSRAEIRKLTSTEVYQRGPLALYGHFREPLYLAQFEGGEAEAEALFREWLELLGLEDRDDVVALNWVKGVKGSSSGLFDNDNVASRRETWSDYFDARLECWDIWCLTFWNPRRRTLGALAASATKCTRTLETLATGQVHEVEA